MTHARKTAAAAALAGVVALTVGALVGPAPGASAASLPDAPRIDWSSCGDGFQCADVPVPLDYDRPTDGTITVALLRLPAADPAKRKGSLFVDPGGPGGSGVAVIRSEGEAYPQEVRDAYDLVGFDPRGVGGSTPLRCFDSEADALAAQHQQKFPVTAADVVEWQRVDRVFADACAAHGGPIIDHMSTANVARDLDLLRRAVGDARLNYLGYSYGTYIGMTYANMFPTTVGAFVIDGVLDPVEWSTGNGATSRTQPFTMRIGSAKGSEDTLDQFLTLCDQVGDRCALSGNARARYEALLERAKAHPIPYPGFPEFLLTYPAIIGATLSGLYTPRWAGTAELLAQLEAQPQATAAAAAASSVGAPVGARAAAGLSPGFGDYPPFEAYAAVPCSETDNPTSFSAWPRAADKEAHRYPHFGALWTWDSTICSIWPARDADRYTGPWRATTSNPVLIVGNYYDASTPYEGALAASRLLKNARLLSYAGWGHSAYRKAGNACVDEAVTRYLLDNTLPARGTVCQPAGTPFDAPANPSLQLPPEPPAF
ncbi:MAG TPA: alpha/beta hydrolase [Lapillicoccus sp.]|nr:alpha/beta hydrolase [Lapillicoccus sp.]